jgi:hypothetical protein
MTKGIRWRIIVLQVGLIGILGFASGFLFWGNSFSHGMVRDQLAAQQIYFPAAGSAALDPKVYPTLQQYAGQQLLTGDQAQVYANDFIGHHLQAIAGGKTYSQVSALAQANPTDTKLAAQVQTLFRGETLRGLLLNGYGWWQVGQYALYAAIGLLIAAIVVLGALVFELGAWRAQVRAVKPNRSGAPSLAMPRPAAS